MEINIDAYDLGRIFSDKAEDLVSECNTLPMNPKKPETIERKQKLQDAIGFLNKISAALLIQRDTDF